MQKRPPPRVWRIRWSLLVVPSSPALLSSQSSIPLLITPTNYEDFLAVDFLAVDFFAVDFRVLFFAADPDDFFVVFLVLFLVDFFVLFFAEDLVDFLLVFFVPLPVDFLPVDFLLDFLALLRFLAGDFGFAEFFGDSTVDQPFGFDAQHAGQRGVVKEVLCICSDDALGRDSCFFFDGVQ